MDGWRDGLGVEDRVCKVSVWRFEGLKVWRFGGFHPEVELNIIPRCLINKIDGFIFM